MKVLWIIRNLFRFLRLTSNSRSYPPLKTVVSFILFFSPVACEDMNKVTVPVISRVLPSVLTMCRGFSSSLIFKLRSETIAAAARIHDNCFFWSSSSYQLTVKVSKDNCTVIVFYCYFSSVTFLILAQIPQHLHHSFLSIFGKDYSWLHLPGLCLILRP